MKYTNSVSLGVVQAYRKGIAPENLIVIAGSCFDSKEQCIENYPKYCRHWDEDGVVDLFSKLWDMDHIIQPRKLYKDIYQWCLNISHCNGDFIFDTLDDLIGNEENNSMHQHNRAIVEALIADGYIA